MMKLKEPSPAMCPKCGHSFVPPGELGMYQLKRLATARVRVLDSEELVAELNAVREFLDDMRAKISRLRKHDLTLHRMANLGRRGRKELHESLDDARARLQKLRKEERRILKRLQKLEA